MSANVRIGFFGSVAEDKRNSILALLQSSGITDSSAEETVIGVPGLAVFDAVDDQLRTMLRDHGSTSAILALSVAPHALDRRTLWSLIEAGAFDVLQWPSLPVSADDVLRRLQRRRHVDELVVSHQVLGTVVGANPEWRLLVRSVVEAAIFTTSSVLITGESGTGKEQLARLIHDLDPRREKGDFIIVDCTTLSPELSGSELFGHERGAFTGAMAARDGAFALAHRGTLFLDEVGELRSELQAQLLRAVHERRYKRVGGNTWLGSDVRIVAATNRDLEHGIMEGRFRSDLFFRIAGWRCRTISLRQRKDDILPLTRHFIAQLLPNQSEVMLDGAVEEFLLACDYPGNVRELRQLVTRICHRYAGGGPITIGDIPPEDRAQIHAEQPLWPENAFRSAVRAAVELGIGMKEITRTAGELAVEMAMEREGGNLHKAASRLGVTDRALQLRRASHPDQMEEQSPRQPQAPDGAPSPAP